MSCGEHSRIQRYTYGLNVLSMDFLAINDHDNGWIPSGTDTAYKEQWDTLYYQQDEMGSVDKVIGPSGKKSAHYNYDQFGRPLGAVKLNVNWSGPDNQLSYTGYNYDFFAGLYYAQNRYYHPETGRFISQDPWPGEITQPRSMNPYPYVLNNPLKYVDPLGLEPLLNGTAKELINTPGSTGTNAAESGWGGCPPSAHEFYDEFIKGIGQLNQENFSRSWTVVRENLPEGAGMFAREGKWLVETVTLTDLDNPYEVTLLLISGPTAKYTTKIAGIVLRKGGSKVYRFADEQSEYIIKKWINGTGKVKSISWITPGSLPKAEEKALLNTLSHLDKGTKPSGKIGKKWGAYFGNKEGHLPSGNYKEYTVAPPPGTTTRGKRRIVENVDTGDLYYTWTHYGQSGNPSFVRIR